LVSFLGMMFLWGLPLASVPVVIHLLNRRRRNVVQWGAMRFLIEAASRRRRMWRWDDWLLMLLRTAAVLALVLALARPLLRSSWFGFAGERDVVLVLDTSLSTSQVAAGSARGDGSLFDALLRASDRIIDDLDDADTVRVLLASTAPEWLTPEPVAVNAEGKIKLKSQLHEVKPTLAGLDMLRCVQEALEAKPANESAARVVTVLTDGQAYGWRVGAGQAWGRLKQKLRTLPTPAVLNVVQVGSETGPAANLSVESLATSRSVVSPGEPAAVRATVKNSGHAATEAAHVSWFQGDEPLGVTSLAALEPGERATVSIAHAFGAPGVHEMTCRVERPDSLEMDNLGHVVVEVVETVSILVIDGAPSADPVDTKTGYLLASLGRARPDLPLDWQSVFAPTVVDVADVPSQRLRDYRCVVAVNISRVPGYVTHALADFVRRGGGLWLALDDMTDRAFFNETFFAAGKGLSPLPIGQAIGDAEDREQFERVRPPSPDHAATRLLADTQRLDLDRGRIYRRYPFDTSKGGREVSVLLETDPGSPLAVENLYGRGRVIVQAVPLGVDWSNLPLCQAFVVMVHEWLWYLTEPSMTRWNLDAGEVLIASFARDRFEPAAEIATPGGTTIEVTPGVQDDRLVYRFGQTLAPGRYALIVKDRQAGPQVFPFHVRRDTRESDLTPLSKEDTQALTVAAGLRFVSDPLADTRASERVPRVKPIWAWLLMALVVLMLIELVFAGLLTRRRWGRTPALAMEPNLNISPQRHQDTKKNG